jgi:tetratricopeptide (TPR) repeat protein
MNKLAKLMKVASRLKYSFLLQRAFVFASKEKYAKALELAERAAKRLGTRSYEATLLVGHCQFKLGRYESARLALDSASSDIDIENSISRHDQLHLKKYIDQYILKESEVGPLDINLLLVTERLIHQFPIREKWLIRRPN